jgi:hypothetical protein
LECVTFSLLLKTFQFEAHDFEVAVLINTEKVGELRI